MGRRLRRLSLRRPGTTHGHRPGKMTPILPFLQPISEGAEQDEEEDSADSQQSTVGLAVSPALGGATGDAGCRAAGELCWSESARSSIPSGTAETADLDLVVQMRMPLTASPQHAGASWLTRLLVWRRAPTTRHCWTCPRCAGCGCSDFC